MASSPWHFLSPQFSVLQEVFGQALNPTKNTNPTHLISISWDFLFDMVKSKLKGTKFETAIDVVKEKVTEMMKGLTGNDLSHCFEEWKSHAERYLSYRSALDSHRSRKGEK
ncbi:hypothetical protein AVEN_121579-1 [Araneus ventricosus]|uniref:Uncharacterized protein n=1 Tax=Araneus ventricosus TaxID=182803 RepID=A0A4Y2VHG5_ARAVE|nr:hypothetical protein AVEN_121579-1 [Araneus ventricosus]